MAQDTAAIQTALRVLSAIIHRVQPDPADVNGLRHLAHDHSTRPMDELAREIVQQAVRRLAAARGDG